jgi:hypothetical protein
LDGGVESALVSAGLTAGDDLRDGVVHGGKCIGEGKVVNGGKGSIILFIAGVCHRLHDPALQFAPNGYKLHPQGADLKWDKGLCYHDIWTGFAPSWRTSVGIIRNRGIHLTQPNPLQRAGIDVVAPDY